MYADRIRLERTRRGMSIRELSELLGVSATAVYKWEAGQSQPNIQTLALLADLFGITMDELCDHVPGAASATGNLAVLSRGFSRLTPEEQEKFLAVGRALFGQVFSGQEEA